MRELDSKLADALSHVEGQWDDERTHDTYIGLEHKRARRKVVRNVAAGLAILAVLGGGVWLSTRDTASPQRAVAESTGDVVAPTPPAPEAVDPPPVALADLELVIPDADATIDVAPLPGDRVAISVVNGRGAFAVPAPVRDRVEITAGDVSIAVFASEFSVARYGQQTDVTVADGYLEVLYDGATERVSAGESRRFGPALEIDADDVEPIAPSHRARRDWRPLAKDGNFDDAFDALEDAGGTAAVRDDVSDLLLAADVFRITGHAAKAVVPLERVVSGYPGDPRTPLAAFTLGRVLLDDLGRPAKAAKAFRTARELAPSGGLAEDALAREVEAWSKAGKLSRARERAELYIESYPRGHRVRAVKKYGGL